MNNMQDSPLNCDQNLHIPIKMTNFGIALLNYIMLATCLFYVILNGICLTFFFNFSLFPLF